MNSTKEKIKTVLISVLIVGMLYLTYAVWFYDSPFGEFKFDSIFDISVYTDVGEGAGSDLERFGIRPLAISVTDNAGRRGAVYKSEMCDEIYTILREELSQCVKKSKEMASSDEASWESALISSGVFLDFRSDIPVSALFLWLSGESDDKTLCGRYYIFSTEKRNVKIYVKNNVNGNIYSADTDVSSEKLKEVMSYVKGDAINFAALKDGEEFGAIIPETLLSEKEITAPVLSAYNSAINFSTDIAAACLEAFGLRDATTSRYAEQDGTEAYIADRITLKISPDGTAVYTDTREEADETLGIIVESEDEFPTLAEKTEQARKLTASLATKLPGDGEIYIISISETGSGTEIAFGRHVGGIPVDMKGTLYFSSIVIKGKSVRSARINLGGYSKTARVAPIVPEHLAAAAVYGSGKEGDLNLRYQDTGETEISPAWYIGGIKKQRETEAK